MTLEDIRDVSVLVDAWHQRELTLGEAWTVLRSRLTEENVSIWMAALPPVLRRYAIARAIDRVTRQGDATALRGVDLGESAELLPALRQWLYDANELVRDPAFSMRPRVPGRAMVSAQASLRTPTTRPRLLQAAPPPMSNSLESLR